MNLSALLGPGEAAMLSPAALKSLELLDLWMEEPSPSALDIAEARQEAKVWMETFFDACDRGDKARMQQAQEMATSIMKSLEQTR